MREYRSIRSIIAILLALLAMPVLAQQPANVPTSSDQSAPICTDRPTKSTFACTVPKGRVQIESDLFNYSRFDRPGTTAETFLLTNPVIKLGIASHTDIQAAIVPYAWVRTTIAGRTTTVAGAGDLFLRLKQRLTADDAPVQFSLVPYVKLPVAAAGIGNRRVEGGVTAASNIALPGGFTLTVAPTLDILANGTGAYHPQLQGLVNLGKQIGPVTLYGELWTAQTFDPAGRVDQYSADLAIAYLLNRDLQLDVGGNFGLNRNTPAVQAYLGVSARF